MLRILPKYQGYMSETIKTKTQFREGIPGTTKINKYNTTAFSLQENMKIRFCDVIIVIDKIKLYFGAFMA